MSLKFEYFSIGSNDGLAPNRGQAIIWTSAYATPWRIYAALGEDEFMIALSTAVYATELNF